VNQKVDVLIIGGGAIGVCSAYYLSERGRQVALIERGEVCSGCSYGNGGLIVPSHSTPLAAPGAVSRALRWMWNPESPFYIKPRFDPDLFSWLWRFYRACDSRRARRAMPILRDLSLASVRAFEELAALDGFEFGFEKRGYLKIFRTLDGYQKEVEEARKLQEIALEVRLLNGIEVRALEPCIRAGMAGGAFYPQDAHIVPDRFVHGLARHAAQKGVVFHPSTEALRIETNGRRITEVQTTRGRFAPNEVVLAGGSWSPGIARELQVKLPIQPAKGYSISFKRPSKCPVIPLGLGEARVAATPMGDVLRFAGTLELAGHDLSVSMRRVQAILRAVPDYLDLAPGNLELIEIWRGLRPCTPDGLPFLGRPLGYENLIIAAGHAMIGISLAPITGKLVAELVARERPSIDLAAFSVERFG
jgi:D-amino-acid dehydrogenase